MRKTANIHLMGGLGNQLFQINFGYYLIKKYNYNINFNNYLCEENFSTNYLLRWKIHNFNCENIFDNFYTYSNNNLIPALASKIKNKKYSYFSLHKWPDSFYSNYFGYFQSKKNLDKIWFKNNLIISKDLYKIQIDPDVITVHIRLTDSETINENMIYYNKILDKYKNHNLRIITDDINKTKVLLSKHGINSIELSKKTALQDFSVLLNSEIIAIAPSTFSWWGAMLNDKIKKIIISKQLYDKLGFYKKIEMDIV